MKRYNLGNVGSFMNRNVINGGLFGLGIQDSRKDRCMTTIERLLKNTYSCLSLYGQPLIHQVNREDVLVVFLYI
jgi:hypothetical protein